MINWQKISRVRFDRVDLNLFISISRLHKLSLAGAEHRMSGVAASVRVRRLEESLGTKLLHRRVRGVELTQCGAAFARFAVTTMHDVGCLTEEMFDHANGMIGHLRVMVDMNSLEFLPETLSAFRAKHPTVGVKLNEAAGRDIAQKMREHEADLGIVLGEVNSSGLRAILSFRDRLVVVAPRAHKLAKNRGVDFRDTLEYRYVEVSEDYATSHLVTTAAKKANVPLRLALRVGHFETLCRMVAANIGIGVGPESVARRYAASMKLSVIPIRAPWAEVTCNVYVRNFEMPEFAKEFTEVLLESATKRMQAWPHDANCEMEAPDAPIPENKAPASTPAG